MVVARDDGGDGGLGDAFHGAEAEGAAGHEGACVAAAYGGVGLACLEEFDGADHGGILFALERLDGFVLHFYDFAGVDDAQARVVVEAFFGQERAQGVFTTH